MASDPERGPFHHRHLERARDEVIELLRRQAVEMELVRRAPQPSHEIVSHLVARTQQVALEQRLAHLHPSDIAFVLESLEPETRARAWSLVRPERRGAVLVEASEVLRRALVQDMEPAAIAQLLRPLASEDVAELIGEVAEESRASVLAQLEAADHSQIRALLSYPSDSVGAAMDLEFVAMPERLTLGEVLEALRRRKGLPPHTTQLFVVDHANRLRGLLSLSQLVLGDPATRVSEAMSAQPVSFFTDDAMSEAASVFEKYDFVAAPVLNLQHQIVGRLTVDVVVDFLRESAELEALRQVGLSKQDEDRFAPIHQAARGRWPWLAINLCTAFVASRIIGAFEPVIQRLVALAALMPIVASVGGNAGNQSVALVIRSLAQSASTPSWLRSFLLRELSIAVLNGGFWGSVLGALCWLLYRDLGLALVLALALWLNLIVAASIGVLSPALLHRSGRDPAMGSSIILTAATDSLGFLIFLGLAALLLL